MLRMIPTSGVVSAGFAALMLALVSSPIASAQQVALTLGSGSAAPGGTTTVNLNLTPSGGALPTGVQWRVTYPLTSIASVTFAAGPAATSAGKTLSCAANAGWVDCLLFGVNTTAIQSGVIATATVTVLQGTAAASASLGVVNPASTGASAGFMATTATGGSITIVQPPPTPSTWSLSGTVSSGSSATVTLSGAANRTTTANSSGNYSFSGLANGTYAVSATKSGGTITPSSRTVSVNGANVTGVNFAYTATAATYTISGTVSSGGSATINLSGSANRSTTANSAGNYSFTGLANGTYGVSASKAGGTITPSSRSVSVNGANVTGVNFAYTATQTTYMISGTVASGSGATVTLSGTPNRTATADGAGKYSFTGVSNGTYTVSPSKASMMFTPSARTVTVNGSNQTGVDFAVQQQSNGKAPQVDSTVWTDNKNPKSTIASPALATRQPNQLLLAFVATYTEWGRNETVRSVAGGGMSWTLVKRSNSIRGTAEVWRAFAPQPVSGVTVTATLSERVQASLTVMSFTGVDATGNGVGAIGATGAYGSWEAAPQAAVTTTRAQSLVFGVGNDVDLHTARVPVSGQSIVHEFVNAPLGTYWVQRFNDPVANAGTQARIRVASPSRTGFNMAAVEVRGPVPVALDMLSSLSGGVPGGATASSSDSSPSPARERRSRTATTGESALANPVTGEPGNACSPGGWASVLGSGFTSQAPQSASSIPLPMSLGGVRVEINGQPAPLLLSSSDQVNFQCPHAPAGTALEIKVATEDGQTWTLARSAMSAAAPAIFTVDGTDRAVVQIASSNQLAVASDPQSSGRPARAGEHVRIYASGLGQAVEELAPGMPAPIDRPIPLQNKVVVLWNGTEVAPLFAGLAPGTVGVFQVDLEVPAGATATTAPLLLRVELADGSTLLTQPTVVPVETTQLLARAR